MPARRNNNLLVNDSNIEMIRAARQRSELQLLQLMEPFVEQMAIAALCGRSKSWASRHANGELGLARNRNYMIGYRQRKKDMKVPQLSEEEKIRLFTERLSLDLAAAFAPLVLSLCESLDDLSDVVHTAAHTVESSNKGVAVKLDALNNIAKTRR